VGHLGNVFLFPNQTCKRLVRICDSSRSPCDAIRLEPEVAQAGQPVWRTVYLLLALFVGLCFGRLALAQSSKLAIDPKNSDARLFLKSSKQPSALVNVGVARVEGWIQWDATEPGFSLMEFAIYPADQGEPELYPSIKNSEKNYQSTENYVVLRFRSKKTVSLGNNHFCLTGTFSVTRVQRLADYDPSKGYSGPVYSPAVVHSSETEATFEFDAANTTEPIDVGQVRDGWMAFGTVRGQDLPELMKAVAATTWPPFVEQEQCTYPSSLGEDFSGLVCTGKSVELQPRSNALCQMWPLQGGLFVKVTCPGPPLQSAGSGATAIKAKRTGSEPEDKSELVTDEVNFQLKVELKR
jgi:hypothetical protein